MMADRDETDEERKALASVTKLDVVPREEPKAYARAPIDWPESKRRGPPPPREWAVEGWLGMGHTTLLSGRGGVGKSYLTQQMGTALALGRDFVSEIAEPRVTLMWSGEDDEDELIRRQIRICEYYGVDREHLAGKLIIEPMVDVECCLLDIVSGRPMRSSMLKELREQIGDYRAGVCVLNNIGCLFGGNENDRYHVTSFCKGVAWAGKASGAAMLLIGHVSKAVGSEWSGSTGWENAVRGRLYFGDKPPDSKPDEESDAVATDMRYLCKRKVNYTARDLASMVWDASAGVYNVITAPQPGGLIDGITKEKARNVVMAAMVKLTAMGITTTDGKTSPNYMPTIIIQYQLNEGKTKRELGIAMAQMMIEGTLKRQVVGQYANATPRYGIVTA